jgi:hypothetical protein
MEVYNVEARRLNRRPLNTRRRSKSVLADSPIGAIGSADRGACRSGRERSCGDECHCGRSPPPPVNVAPQLQGMRRMRGLDTCFMVHRC